MYYNGIIAGATSETLSTYRVVITRIWYKNLWIATITEFVVDCVPTNAIDDGTSILPLLLAFAGTTLSRR
jgi:hypothetical protein